MIILKSYSFIESKLVIFHDIKQKAMVYIQTSWAVARLKTCDSPTYLNLQRISPEKQVLRYGDHRALYAHDALLSLDEDGVHLSLDEGDALALHNLLA